MSSATYKARINVPVTQQMHDFVQVLARRQKTTVADVTRQALRDYLDVQEDLIGSRSRMGNRIARQLAEMQERFQEQQFHADTLLLAAIILTEMRQGKEGSKVLRDIATLATHAAPEIRAVLAASAETDRHLPSGS